jgi:hypothetical protein
MCSDEATLRKRIQELQHYRRMGLTTAADIDKFENDAIKRVARFFLFSSFSWLTLVPKIGSGQI